eukprot:gene4413-5421_t
MSDDDHQMEEALGSPSLEDLYSRQIFAIGPKAMQDISSSGVLVIGANALGSEIAKNLVLAGVSTIAMYDNEPVQPRDLSAQYLFADFGEEYTVRDPIGGMPSVHLVESITQDCPAAVTLVEEQRPDLQPGDSVVFTGVPNIPTLNDGTPRPITITGSNAFTIQDDTRQCEAASPVTHSGYVQKIPAPREMRFSCLKEAVENPVLAGSDAAQIARMQLLHLAFRALDSFQAQQGRLPAHGSTVDDELLLSIATTINGSATQLARVEELDADVLRALARGAAAELAPMATVAGALAAQEVLKAVSHTFLPLRQWLYVDALECVPAVGSVSAESDSPGEEEIPEAAEAAAAGRYEAQVAVLGRGIQERLGSLHFFLVGAGAVGCETLKLWALMGVGAGVSGAVTVADADVVERSNLNRQILFRPTDVGRLKVQVASEIAQEVNEDMTVHPRKVHVDQQHCSELGAQFFESLSGIFSAVDSTTARMFLDECCVQHRLPMVDPGTIGTLGSVQVVVDHQSETWSASRDPSDEKSVPVCTLNHFPYLPDHTLEWARDLFDRVFSQRPTIVNSYLGEKDFADMLKKKPSGEKGTLMEMLHDALVKHKTLTHEGCIVWARIQFEEHFVNNIKQLLHNFSPAMLTTAGNPFWSGTKRVPSPLHFDADNTLHMDFVLAAANLQAAVFGLKGCITTSQIKRVVPSVHLEPFMPREGVDIPVSDAAKQRSMPAGTSGTQPASDESMDTFGFQDLPSPGDLAGYRLTPLVFDPDDCVKYHIQFVQAAANCRCSNYSIPPAPRLQCRQKAGGLLPALCTTSAMVAGLACLEMYKLVSKAPLDRFKNSFVNLALPRLVAATPL